MPDTYLSMEIEWATETVSQQIGVWPYTRELIKRYGFTNLSEAQIGKIVRRIIEENGGKQIFERNEIIKYPANKMQIVILLGIEIPQNTTGTIEVEITRNDEHKIWKKTRTWDSSLENEFREKFVANAIKIAQNAQKNNEIIDCADVALTALAETASAMGLELTFTVWDSSKGNGGWTDISSGDSRFESKAGFISYIRINMGALTLLDDRTTKNTSITTLIRGDLVMFDLRVSNSPDYGGHTMITTGEIDASRNTINTVQGHIDRPPSIEAYYLGGTVDGISPQYRRFRFDKLFR